MVWVRARGPLRTQMRAAARRRGRATEGPRQAQARRAKRAELRNEKKRTKTNESGKEADVRAWITYVYVCTVDTHCKTSQVLYCNVSHLFTCDSTMDSTTCVAFHIRLFH